MAPLMRNLVNQSAGPADDKLLPAVSVAADAVNVLPQPYTTTSVPVVHCCQQASRTLVSRLPVEIIDEIIVCAVQRSVAAADYCLFDRDESHVRLRLALVCRLWHALVKDAASRGTLYQLVNLGAVCAATALSEARQVARVQSFVTRSRGKPLDVILDVQHQEDGALMPYLRPICEESHRWSAVTIRGDLREAATSLALLKGNLTGLWHLSIAHVAYGLIPAQDEEGDDTDDSDDESENSDDIDYVDFDIFSDAPALTSVTILGQTYSYVNPVLPLEQLRSFSCADIGAHTLLNIIASAPLLEELHWDIGPNVCTSEIDHVLDWEDDLPTLSHLAVLGVGDAVYAMRSGIFEALKFPALREVSFNDCALKIQDHISDKVFARTAKPVRVDRSVE